MQPPPAPHDPNPPGKRDRRSGSGGAGCANVLDVAQMGCCLAELISCFNVMAAAILALALLILR